MVILEDTTWRHNTDASVLLEWPHPGADTPSRILWTTREADTLDAVAVACDPLHIEQAWTDYDRHTSPDPVRDLVLATIRGRRVALDRERAALIWRISDAPDSGMQVEHLIDAFPDVPPRRTGWHIRELVTRGALAARDGYVELSDDSRAVVRELGRDSNAEWRAPS